jgi:hypothetical protein
MKYLILIFCLFYTLSTNAQKIETNRIVKVSDSILLANTNEKLFGYFQISIGSYYTYQNKNKLNTGKFLTKKKLKQHVREIWVLYTFVYPDIEGVRGGSWIKLDNELKLIEPVKLDYIPKFIWENRPCDFISKQKALKQGISYFRNDGIEIKEPYLEYDEKLRIYVYKITNILTKDKNINGRNIGIAETVKINAYSGEFLDIEEWTYGLIIR